MELLLLISDTVTSGVEKLMQQGPAFVCLVLAVFYFYRKVTQLEKRLETYMEEDRVKMLDAVGNTNRIIEENHTFMKEILDELKALRK